MRTSNVLQLHKKLKVNFFAGTYGSSIRKVEVTVGFFFFGIDKDVNGLESPTVHIP